MVKSILWSDGSAAQDKSLIETLVNDIVIGDSVHKQGCVEKIMQQISTTQWQERFPQRYFVFCVYYGIGVSLVEIRSSLYLQAIDALYIYLVPPSQRREKNFRIKICRVFKAVYGRQMPYDTAEAIRILRNRVMHSGTIVGNRLFTQEDQWIHDFLDVMFSKDEQETTEVQRLTHLAGAMNRVVKDIVIRVLGLRWDDLLRNAIPPSMSALFSTDADRSQLHDFTL